MSFAGELDKTQAEALAKLDLLNARMNWLLAQARKLTNRLAL